MPRKCNPPIYSKNTAKGKAYAYCIVNGTRISLGKYGSAESWEQFRKCLIAYEQNEDAQAVYSPEPQRETTVGEMAEAYLKHVIDRQSKGLLCRDRVYASRVAMRALTTPGLALAGIAADRFGPKALKAIQVELLGMKNPRTGKSFARGYVNQTVNEIRRAFKWAASEELLTVNVHERIKAVSGLKAGEGRENQPRQPASPALVEATTQHLKEDGHAGIAGAIRFMRWTGCRPDEACRLTLRSLEGLNSPEPVARLTEHKTRKSTGQDRVIPLGPQALAVVREAMREPELERRLFVSRAGEPLRPNGIYQAVQRTCRRYGLERWTPYQLRHLAATEVLESTGSEVMAAAALGHSPSSTIVRRYSQDRAKLARSGINAIGFRENVSA